MKIAYVYDAIYPFVYGGVERRIWEISKRLVRRGHQVHIYGMKFWEGPAVISREGIVIHGICPYARFYRGGKRSVAEAVLFAVSCFIPLFRDRYDIIDCQEFPYLHCFTARPAAILRGSRFIVTWHEIWGKYWYQYLGHAGFFGVAIERLLAWMPAGHIAVSDITGRDLLHISGNNRLEIIPNGIDFAQIERIPPSGYESDLVFAGRLIRDKNVDILIRAVKILLPDAPGLRCVIIGDGPEMDDLKSLARDLGVEGAVRFTGFLQDPGEVIGFMKSSKVFVFPSTREGFGIAAMEALACGLPLVTSDHQRNAARSFVRAETGCLCNLTPEDFARGIRVCLENRSGMHDCCIELSCSYDWERISDRCEQYYLPGNTQ